MYWIKSKCEKAMNLLGLEWAPLNVPLERRIQTAMALFWIVSLAFGGFICGFLFAYILIFTKYYPLAFLYLAWMYYDRNTSVTGGRRNLWVRKLGCWKYFIDFFPLKVKRTAELSKDENYMMCVFPHGVLSAGAFGHFGNDCSEFSKLFSGLRVYSATLDMHFNTPFFREYLFTLGAISASQKSLMYILNGKEKGRILTLVVGGAAESLFAHPGLNKIVLKNRKGFVRIALKTGTQLVPVYSFGETDIYSQAWNPPGSLLHRFQTFLRKYIGMAPCIFSGRGILQYNFGLIPRRRPVTTVVGKPIKLPKIDQPTQEDVDKYHKIFMDELVALFEEHKHDCVENPNETELIID